MKHINNTVNRKPSPKERVDEIKYQLKAGLVSYDEAKEMSQEPLKEMNQRMREISAEHGFKHRNVSFVGFMR